MVFISAIPFIVYIPTLSGWFIADDYGLSSILGMSGKDMLTCINLIHDGQLSMYPFRPVAFISLRLDYLVWGWNSFGFHLTNTVLHSINVFLIYALVRSLKMSKSAAFSSALFYGLYAGFSEAIIWISCRFDLLSQALFLTSLLVWISGRGRNSRFLLTISVVLYLVCLFAKETNVGGLVLFPIIDWVFLRNKHEHPARLKFWLGWVGALILDIVILTAVRVWLLGNFTGLGRGTGNEQFFGTSVLDCINHFFQDLLMMLTPVSRLIFTDFSVWYIGIILSVFIIAGIVGAIASARNGNSLPCKLLLLGFIWIVFLVSPTLFVNPVDINLGASRFLYLPCVGLAIIIGIGIESFRLKPQSYLLGLLAILLASFILILWQYNNVSYIEAGRIIKNVDQVLQSNTQDIQNGDTVVIVNMPPLWNGAYFSPNGYTNYLQWIHGRRYLSLQYTWKDPKDIHDWYQQLKKAQGKHYYGFVWDDTQQVLEPLQ